MIAIEYNMDEAAKGGIGFVVYPDSELTLAKHEDGSYSMDFIDSEGGCLTRISITAEVLHNLIVLRDHEQPKAVMLMKDTRPAPKLDFEPPF